MKKTLSLILALMLMLSFSQINTLFSSFASMKQPGPDIWSYAVTDLDHNGRLELLAACMKGADRRTSLLAWEVTPDGTAVAQIPTSGAYPDVIKGSADTYHNLADGTWAYQFDDVAPHAAADLAENKCTVQLKDGKLSFSAFANKLISAQAGQSPISYFNGAGQAITPEDYNAAAQLCHLQRLCDAGLAGGCCRQGCRSRCGADRHESQCRSPDHQEPDK